MVDTQKIDDFVQALDEVDPAYGKDVGIIVCENDNEVESVLSNLSEQSGTVLKADGENTADNLIHTMSKQLEQGGSVYLEIGTSLPPKLYNQLKLIAESARVQYFQPEEDKTIDLPDDARIVLISSKSKLEKLNYSNIFMLGPVFKVW